MTHALRFESIENFRDFGGYSAGERRLARGILYRSANHAFATDDDLEAVRALNVKTIIDLRRPSEREKRPSRRWEGFDGRVIEGDHEYESDVVWEEFIQTSDHSAESFRWYLTEFYKSAPFAPRHIDLFTRYFETLAETDGPLLVHCAGGKDRTGMLCALTHVLLGVHHDDVMSDFLATNELVRVDRIGPTWARDIGEEVGREPKLENLTVAMRVEPQYLDAAFDAIRTRYGSLDFYLQNALGVDAERRESIEARVFE